MFNARLEVVHGNYGGLVGIDNVLLPNGTSGAVDVPFWPYESTEAVIQNVTDRVARVCSLANRVCDATIEICGNNGSVEIAFLECSKEDCSLAEVFKY